MKRFIPLMLFACIISSPLFSEGTRELAPNGSIMINDNATTDVAALHINHPNYNLFAAYTNPDPQSRLYIHIKDPAKECVYFGFSFGHPNQSTPNPPRISFDFRVKDPNGNVVYGPISVSPAGININNWSEGFTGPMQLHGAGGYNAFQATSADLASQGFTGAGDYYIEFTNEEGSDFLIDFWDITVADCSGIIQQEKKGRVWSYNWAIFAVNDFGFPNRPFNGAFFVCAPDPDNEQASFVTKIDFNGSGFRPAAFNIAFNSFGSFNTGDVMQDRRSVMNTNATRAEYSIFLNDPIEICETADIGEISLLGVSRCDAESYCIKFITSKAGQVDILLDFDGNDNIYTPGTADLMVVQSVSSDQVGVPSCIDWDGKDGLGNLISESPGTQIPVTISFAQGIYHFPIYDAELMTNGVTIQAIRPIAPTPLLYYDDSEISVLSGSGEPAVQLSGCVTPCHRWINYTMPNTPGFGNLHTINSWWFSQLIVRQDVFFLPAYLECEIEGPASFCSGATSQLTSKPLVQPAGAPDPEIISTQWTGPGIVGPTNVSEIVIDAGGEYTVEVHWLTGLGDTCSATCTYEVVRNPPLTAAIDTLILYGDEVDINGEVYTEGGTYIQALHTAEGCDSILTIRVKVINTVIHYDLNACVAFMSDNTHMDYSEFIPAIPQPLSCAEISGTTIHRTPPENNKHSCTPGVNNSVAMCVGSLDDCDYAAGHENAILFELNITPDADTAVQVTGIEFYAQAPANYNWISGPSGVNNYPTLYGIRILKNGTEIYRVEDIPTTLAWSLESFDFSADDNFIVDEAATFTFELLPYCLIGNGSDVAAWDIDEVSIQASCVSPAELNPIVSGEVFTRAGLPVPAVEMTIAHTLTSPVLQHTWTVEEGTYTFDPIERKKEYVIQAAKDGDDMNGVSTLDLLLIQKHLLGISPFTSAYQYIAADANRSHSVSALDLIELRKLILGIYDELPRNTSWRFGDAAQTPDISLPWALKEFITVEYITKDLTDMNFVGIKIGDINGDVTPDVISNVIHNRDILQLRLEVADFTLRAGDEALIDVTSKDLWELSGLQLELKGKGLEMLSAESGLLDMTASDFYLVDGDIRISWISEQPVPLGKNEVLFRIRVKSHADSDVRNMIRIEESKIHAEAYVNDPLDKANVQLHFIKGEQPVLEKPSLHITPNPVNSEAKISVEVSYAQQIKLLFYDMAGRLLYGRVEEVEAGLNTFIVTTNELSVGQGMVICQMQTEHHTVVERIVVVKH